MNIAIYRMYYGEDFIERSVRSIINDFDRIFIMYTDRPWGEFWTVTYKGKIYDIPCPIDKAVHIAKDLEREFPGKVYALYHHNMGPDNQFTEIYNYLLRRKLVEKCHVVMLMEHDMIWPEGKLAPLLKIIGETRANCLATYMIEFWKNEKYMIPIRKRVGAKFYNLEKFKEFPFTGKDGVPLYLPWAFIPHYVYNYGFCMSERNMFWKHLICLEASKHIADSKPAEDWYESKWLTWDYEKNNKDLEISERYRSDIPYAFPFDYNKIHELIGERYRS